MACEWIGILLALFMAVPLQAAELNSENRSGSRGTEPAGNKTTADTERAPRAADGKNKVKDTALARDGAPATRISGSKIRLEGEELLIMKESDIPGGQPRNAEQSGKNGSRQQLQDAFLNPVRKQKHPPAPPASGDVLHPKQGGQNRKGTVKWFNTEKGYGFIQPDAGGKDASKPGEGTRGIAGAAGSIDSKKTPGRAPHAGTEQRVWPNKWSGPSAKSANTGDSPHADREEGRHTPFFNNYRPQFYMRPTSSTADGNREKIKPRPDTGVDAARPGKGDEMPGQATDMPAQPGLFGRKNPHQRTQ